MPEDKPVEVQTPAPASTPSVVPAPATTTVPVETQKAPVTPAPVAPVTTVAPSTEQLLKVEPIQKPTVEALKLPENVYVPKEKIASIVSQSKTIEEAQSRVEFANGLYAEGLQESETKNQTRLSELKGDPELGGQKWDETKALYQAGMKRLFGDEAIKDVVAAKLDALPWLVRGIVRAERAATAKPIVSGEPIKPEGPVLQDHERVYGKDKDYNPLAPTNPLNKPISAPRI